MDTVGTGDVLFEQGEGWVALRVPAEGGSAGARHFLQAARAALALPGRLSVDCGLAEFLDTPALQVLLALQRTCQARQRTLEVLGLPDKVRSYLKLAGLDEEFPVGSRPPEQGDDAR